MPCRIVTTAYGRPAAVALHREIVAAKRDEPLAPVTVVVPANSVGVATRRLLAGGDLGPVTAAGAGLVGVGFLTVYRLAELLGATRLAAAGRRPVSTPVVGAAVRAVLARRAGLFAPVAHHPATEEALVSAHRELSDLDAGALDRLARQSPRAGDVVRIHRDVTRALAPAWYAEADLMAAATDAVVEGSPLLRDLGTVVVHLPQRVGPPAARLLAALGDRVPVVVLLGCTGVEAADAVPRAGVRRILGDATVPDGAPAEPPPAAPTTVATFSDADDEVRHVVRGVVDAMRAGVPLERMAVVYAAEVPYSRLLHEHLELAGIPHNGLSVRTLADAVLGRTLLGLLALPDAGFRRDEVMRVLTLAPFRAHDGRRADALDAAAWERVSRSAGVVGGLDQWADRLAAYADRFDPAAGGWDAREHARAVALAEQVAALAADLDPERVPASWSGKVRWAHRLVNRWLGDERRRAEWPAAEQDAARRVESALDRLAGLDTIEPAPSLDVFRRTLELELRAARERVGRLGEGLLAGPVGAALGVECERLWVCGLAEGVFPAVPREDAVLGDAERAVLDGDLPCRSERVGDDHRALLATLASASGARVLGFPRGDLRRTTERVPSRFLLDVVEAMAGRRELDTRAPWCAPVASFAQGVQRVAFPATAHEHDVRTVLVSGHAVGARLTRSQALVAARAGAAFTRFDGNLAEIAAQVRDRGPAAGRAVTSATRLETYAGCPHAYFVGHLLHVRPVEPPEDILTLSPIERGNIVHRTLDRFVAEGGDVADRQRLHDLADEECARAEESGLAGRRLLWHRERRLIHVWLDEWLDADAEARAAQGARPVGTEMRFDALDIVLPDGRTLRMRGSIDRVDRTAGGQILVVDYKTGSPDGFKVLNGDDPVAAGLHLQLPVYARAARALLGEPDAPVHADFWFVGRGENVRIGYPVDAAVEKRFEEVLGQILDGIEAGCFPAVPPGPGPRGPFIQCVYCDPDGLGTADRWREWERKSAAREMAPYTQLLVVDDDVVGDEA